jgi:ABC-type dipeptide/oligopeptide/nickel transport system ATPase subunit
VTPLLEARDVTVRFGHGADAFDAVRGASVAVHPGEAIGIVGESGSGKTTLMRALVGLQPPTEGEIWLEGRKILDAGSGARFPRADRWKVQMVFQDPYSSLNPRQRAWQTVAEALHVWRGLSGGAARAAALDLLRSMGISDEQARQLPKTLSGGQRQRTSVARALAPNPRVLIADEPTSSIDQSAQAQLLNLLRALQRDRGLAVIFVSHDLGIVRYLTSRVYVMRRGEIVETGETAEVFARPRHEYTQRLIASIPGTARLAQSSDLIR